MSDDIKTLIIEKCNVIHRNLSQSNKDSYKNFEYPLDSDLSLFLFQNILEWKIPRCIEEKVDFIINFFWNGKMVTLIKRKFGFECFFSQSDFTAFNIFFEELMQLLESYLLKLTEIQLSENTIVLPNYYNNLMERFLFYQNEIETAFEKIGDDFFEFQFDMGNIMYTTRKPENAGVYLMNVSYSYYSYIDIFYSLLEHLCVLLYVFSNRSIQYKKMVGLKWAKKFEYIVNDTTAKDLLEFLKEIKEFVRNPQSHGFFSSQSNICIQLDKIGIYPIAIGSRHNGFTREHFRFSEKSFDYVKSVFSNTFALLTDKYEPEMMIISHGLNLHLKIDYYKDITVSKQKTQDYIENQDYLYEKQMNMDW